MLHPNMGRDAQDYVARVTVDDLKITVEGAGEHDFMRWDQLQWVVIEATMEEEGRSLIWRLQGLGVRRCRIPFGIEGEQLMLARLQNLPGFDVLAVAEALCGSDAGRFICWRRDRSA